jgi:hypothetical protein
VYTINISALNFSFFIFSQIQFFWKNRKRYNENFFRHFFQALFSYKGKIYKNIFFIENIQKYNVKREKKYKRSCKKTRFWQPLILGLATSRLVTGTHPSGH